ncbi:DUF2808 domain-containing protein [Pseudanabaena sp. BC1403]|uniref:DUF2808 domain-containing protein n=1 Tax=Pseudanabaena sp. BC1403 TaxID=2043171 RepID=UPI000CD874A4|nr:DUF2808 domain-containing protein [Pseudanabaena sp. BC1403]
MVKKTRKKVVTAIALLPILALQVFGGSNQNLVSRDFLTPSAEAVQLRDGKTYFVQLPFLLGAETTINRIYSWNATYYFAIALPQNMGEPLQKLEIAQTEGFDNVDFYSNETIAYLQSSSGERVAISSKTEVLPSQDRDRQKVTITFNPPISASNELNSKLVVGLRPVRNPRYDGVYLFGVTAFPQGDRPNSQFLGYGRLSFYDLRY